MKVKSESEVTQSCLTLRDPRDCSPPGSSVRQEHWSAVPFPEGLPDPRIEPASLMLQQLAREFFTTVSPGKPQFGLLAPNFHLLSICSPMTLLWYCLVNLGIVWGFFFWTLKKWGYDSPNIKFTILKLHSAAAFKCSCNILQSFSLAKLEHFHHPKNKPCTH